MKSLSFIIPVFNEADRIGVTFTALKSFKSPTGITLSEIIFVNDGSTDTTVKKVRSFATKNKALPIKIISYKKNMGKGFAIRTGMLAATGDYALFFDADISTPLSEFKKFLPLMNTSVDVVIGTRKNGKSTVIKHQPRYREILGKGFTKLTQTILQVNVTDFTCGFKMFSRDAVTKIFPSTVINRWGYDAEIVYLATRNGLSIQEVPVVWANDDRSKVVLYKAVPKSFMELFQIRYEHSSVRKVIAFYSKLILKPYLLTK